MFINLNTLVLKLRNTKNYSDFIFFDYELSLESPSINPLVKDVLSLIEKYNPKDTDHLAVILANLIRNLGHGGVYSAFPMKDSKIPSCVNGFGLRRFRIKNLMLDLRDYDLVEFQIGSRDNKTGRRLRTKVRASAKLIELIKPIYPEGVMLVRPAVRECIRLRDKAHKTKADYIDYKDTEKVSRMRARLRRYNQLLGKSSITLNKATPSQDVIQIPDFSQTFTYRVFNDGKWNRGGRFYGGWWLNIPSEERQHILINREATVEFDFCNQALVLLYAMEGIHYGDRGADGYTVIDDKGKPYPRAAVKSMFTIAINCPSAKRTISAFLKNYRNIKAEAELQGTPFTSFPNAVLNNPICMLDTFGEHHQQIAHHLFKPEPIGLWLQFLDSLIAEEILRVMTWKKIPVLCIHDSFVCAIQHEEVLLQVMADAYIRILRERLGFESQGVLRLKRISQGEGDIFSLGFRIATKE